MLDSHGYVYMYLVLNESLQPLNTRKAITMTETVSKRTTATAVPPMMAAVPEHSVSGQVIVSVVLTAVLQTSEAEEKQEEWYTLE